LQKSGTGAYVRKRERQRLLLLRNTTDLKCMIALYEISAVSV